MAAKKQASGGARMMAAGRKPVMIGPTADEKDILDRAAQIDGRPTSNFVLNHALIAAKKILAKST